MRITACLLIAVSLLLAGSFLAWHREARAAGAQVSEELPPDLQPRPQTLFSGFWRVDDGFIATLRIKNSLVVGPVDVTPILYMADGAEYALPAVHLAATEVATLNINEALSRVPASLAGHLSLFGSAALKYQYASSGHVLGSIENLNPGRSLIFTYPFVGADEVQGGFQTLEGLWWKNDPGVTGFVAISNHSGAEVSVTLRAFGSRGAAAGPKVVTVAQGATEMVDIDRLASGLPANQAAAGGLRVEFSANDGPVLVSGGLLNPRTGYSAKLPFMAPRGAQAPAPIMYASAGMMVGRPPAAENFPRETRFTPYVLMRNTTGRLLPVTIGANYMQDGNPARLGIPDQVLAPLETRSVPLGAFLSSRGLGNFSGELNVSFLFTGRPGDLVVSTGSVDQTGNYVFQVEPQGAGQSAGKEASYWAVGNGWDTMFSIWNPTDQTQDVIATFFFKGGAGKYTLPVHLEAGASTTIGMAQLIAAGQRDADGNVIPFDAGEGSAAFSSAAGMGEPITLVFSGGTFNALNGTCGNTCWSCCGYSNFRIAEPNFVCLVGGTGQCHAQATYCNGVVTDFTTNVGWSSSDTNLLTVNSGGGISGISPGSVSVIAQFSSVPLTMTVCDPNNCGYTSPRPTADGTVIQAQVTTANIVTDLILVTLSPSSSSGNLVVTLVGGSHTIQLFSGSKAGGTWSFSFQPATLPIDQYNSVQASWTLGAATATGSRAVSFKVLGTYTHSAYNTPYETNCVQAPSVADIVTNSNTCAYQQGSLRSDFISQANQQGTGNSDFSGYWLLGREFFCSTPHSSAKFRQITSVTGSCGSVSNNSTVAKSPSNTELACGDQVLIVGLGASPGTVKTVNDTCPGCQTAQLDNYTTDPSCGNIASPGNFTTIRLR